MSGPFNPSDALEVLSDFAQDLRKVMDIISRNKRELKDLKKDVKTLINALDRLSTPENMRAFREFTNELRVFNQNSKVLINRMNEFRETLEQVSEVVKALKGE